MELSVGLLRTSQGSLWAVVKGLFTGIGVGTDGVRTTAAEQPKLFAAIHEVARRVDTDPVDEVYVVPGSDMAVKQEGRGPFGVFGSRRRVLILGLATMHSVSELKAILAHEYAHFSHQDTLYIRFIGQVTLTLAATQHEMKQSGGWLTYVNPFFWFFYLYARSYRMLSAGFSRSREFLADRMACSLYGSDVFLSGLTRVYTDATLFEIVIYENVVEKLRRGKALVNLYEAFRAFRAEGLTAAEREKFNKKLLGEKGSLFASHPTYSERKEAALPLPEAVTTDNVPAMSLFEDPTAVEKEMTDFLFGYARRLMRGR
jgi:Zn-dependent protease with chaperone function